MSLLPRQQQPANISSLSQRDVDVHGSVRDMSIARGSPRPLSWPRPPPIPPHPPAPDKVQCPVVISRMPYRRNHTVATFGVTGGVPPLGPAAVPSPSASTVTLGRGAGQGYARCTQGGWAAPGRRHVTVPLEEEVTRRRGVASAWARGPRPQAGSSRGPGRAPEPKASRFLDTGRLCSHHPTYTGREVRALWTRLRDSCLVESKE